jgi:hypothetical protein
MPFLPQASNWSFNQHLQDEFDRETPLAWSVAFDMIAETMIRVMVNQTIDPKLPENPTIWRPTQISSYCSAPDLPCG